MAEDKESEEIKEAPATDPVPTPSPLTGKFAAQWNWALWKIRKTNRSGRHPL